MDCQRHLRMQRFVKMMAVTQAGQGIEQRFFQQALRKTLTQAPGPTLPPSARDIGRSVTGGDVLESQQANGFAWAMSGTQSDQPTCASPADDSR